MLFKFSESTISVISHLLRPLNYVCLFFPLKIVLKLHPCRNLKTVCKSFCMYGIADKKFNLAKQYSSRIE